MGTLIHDHGIAQHQERIKKREETKDKRPPHAEGKDQPGVKPG
jgi:hypothetical protein